MGKVVVRSRLQNCNQRFFRSGLLVRCVNRAVPERLKPRTRLRTKIVTESLIEVGRRQLQRARKDGRRFRSFFVELKHLEYRVEAELPIDEIAHHRSLEVSYRDSVRSLRMSERGIEIVDLNEPAVLVRLQILKRPVVAPALSRASFFVDR